MSKRGTGHTWQLVKYNGNVSIYAKCKCRYHYRCSVEVNRNDCSRNTFRQVPTIFYPYCPICGARKKWFTNEMKKIDKYEFDDI